MKLITILTLVSMLVFSGCSDDSASPAADVVVAEDSESEAPTTTSDAPTITFQNSNSSIIQSPLPSASDVASQPVISDFPDVLFLGEQTVERFELTLQNNSNVSALLLAAENATSHSRLEIDDCCNMPSSDGRLGISIELQLDGIASGCYRLAVEDERELVSDSVEICLVESPLTSSDQSTLGRVIHFANFASNSVLSTVSLADRKVSVIGSTGVNLTDIAWLDDTLYGITFSALYRLDPESGVASLVGRLNNGSVNALEAGEGVLFAATTGGNFLTINPVDGSSNIISRFASGARSSGDLVFDDDGNLWFTAQVTGLAYDQLLRVDPATGDSEIIGSTGYNQVWGLAWSRNQLLGFTNAGEFLLLDQSTGAGTVIEKADHYRAGGASAQFQ